jgi:hypothetical protein
VIRDGAVYWSKDYPTDNNDVNQSMHTIYMLHTKDQLDKIESDNMFIEFDCDQNAPPSPQIKSY